MTSKRRKGRGIGCGNGKTCGRGHKGQKARTGTAIKDYFEGGQTPLTRRIPKSGFTCDKNKFTKVILFEKLTLNTPILTLKNLVDIKLITQDTKKVKFIQGKIGSNLIFKVTDSNITWSASLNDHFVKEYA